MLELPYMKISREEAANGVLAIGENDRNTEEGFFLPALAAALNWRAQVRSDHGPAGSKRTWLIFDFKGTLSPMIREMAEAIGLADEVAECGTSEDVKLSHVAGRIAIFNWKASTSRVAKEERGMGRTSQTSMNNTGNVSNQVKHILTEHLDKNPLMPSLIFSQRLTYPQRSSGNDWAEPWAIAKLCLGQDSMVLLGHSHLIDIQEETAEFPFYDRIKTKLFWRCQHIGTAEKVAEWARWLEPDNTLPKNTTYNLDKGTDPYAANPGEIITLKWDGVHGGKVAVSTPLGELPEELPQENPEPETHDQTETKDADTPAEQPSGGPAVIAKAAKQKDPWRLW